MVPSQTPAEWEMVPIVRFPSGYRHPSWRTELLGAECCECRHRNKTPARLRTVPDVSAGILTMSLPCAKRYTLSLIGSARSQFQVVMGARFAHALRVLSSPLEIRSQDG